MQRPDVEALFARLDRELREETKIFLYGSAALMLLGAEGRSSLGIDVAGPHSIADRSDLDPAAERAGLPVNPPPEVDLPHLEWVLEPRLCLPIPEVGREIVLWAGRRLTVVTSSPADLAASKLIRYDDTDRADVAFLVTRLRVTPEDVRSSVERLPPAFRRDPVIAENLANLSADIELWTGGRAP